MTGFLRSRNPVPADYIDAVQLAWDIVEHAERKGGLVQLRGMDLRGMYTLLYTKIVERDGWASKHIQDESLIVHLTSNPDTDPLMARSIWKKPSAITGE